jgi:hypothetical protein
MLSSPPLPFEADADKQMIKFKFKSHCANACLVGDGCWGFVIQP